MVLITPCCAACRKPLLNASPCWCAACHAGCILGELLTGKPIFPGSSTMNQLDRIMELTGRPSAEDLESIQSPFAATMMESCSTMQAKRIQDLFPHASKDACDLLMRLLQFNPKKRIRWAPAHTSAHVASCCNGTHSGRSFS